MDGAADFQSRDAARDHVFPEQVVIGAIGGAISYNSAQARTKFPARAREPNAFIVDIGRFSNLRVVQFRSSPGAWRYRSA